MAKPPSTPPHSDIEGVNRDARIGRPSRDEKPDPGKAIADEKRRSIGRPDHGASPESTDDQDQPPVGARGEQ